MENVLESLSPLSAVVHDEDFTGLGEHTESMPGHLSSVVDASLGQPSSSVIGGDDGEDDDDDGLVSTMVVHPSLADDEDDPIVGLGVAASSDPTQVLHHHHQSSLQVSPLEAVGEEGGVNVNHGESHDPTTAVVGLPDGHVLSSDAQLVQSANGEGILLTTDADGNLAVPVSAESVIRFLMQTSDGSMVAANAPMDAIKLSMPGLMTGDSGELTPTVQAVTLPDGTTTLIRTQHKTGVEEQPALPKFVEGQTIKLEDGTTALLQATPPEAMNEGLQAIQLEDGSTAFITQGHHGGGLFPGAVHQLDATSLHLDQLASQTMLAAVERQSEKALVIGDKAYKCMFPECGRLYTTHHHLKVHERSHTGDRPFECQFKGCGKRFATGYGLKSHNRVHTGEKPYPCPHTDKGCEKAFKTSGDLQKHVRTHTGERPFKCPFEGCTQSFTTSNIRKVHIRTHTGERPYICNVEGCGRAFASATNYKNHIRIHTGEKPYVCSMRGCGKRFTEYSSLYKHHVVHTHTKPYTCHCGKTYRQTSTLAMHKRTAHGEEAGSVNGVDNEVDDPPVKKQRMMKTEALSTDDSTAVQGQGHFLVNTSDGSQMVLFAQGLPTDTTLLPSVSSHSSTITATTTATTTIHSMVSDPNLEESPNSATTLLPSGALNTTVSTIDPGINSLQQQQQQQQEIAGLVTIPGFQGLQALQGIPGLESLSGLQGLTLPDTGQHVLVVTDPAQLEALQQLAQHLESTAAQPTVQVAVAGGDGTEEAEEMKPAVVSLGH